MGQCGISRKQQSLQNASSIPGVDGHIDFNVFTDCNVSDCDGTTATNSPTASCSHLQRLCNASKYWDLVMCSKLNQEKKEALLVEFLQEIYASILNDVVHLTKVHDGDIAVIYKEWIEKNSFPKCSVSECAKTARHYGRNRRGSNDENDIREEALFLFYKSLFDTVHNYVAHLYDMGLRVDEKASLDNVGEEKKDDDDVDAGWMTTNKAFISLKELIQKKQIDSNVDAERLSAGNSKFTIQMVLEQEGKTTLKDEILRKIWKTDNVQNEMLQTLWVYLERNEYDSECIEMDIEDFTESNLHQHVDDQIMMRNLKSFIENIHLRRSAFSTGFIFHYWSKSSWWNTAKEDEMFVKSKHSSLMDEIIESGFLSLAKWRDLVELKAKRFLNTNAIRKLKAKRAGEMYGTFTNQIEAGSPVTLQHLFAIILYCDFSDLCTAFSATFRLENVFEDIESLKERHSKFAIFGRLLVELVLDFGINGDEDKYGRHKTDGYEYERGPFFCGLNCTLNIGSFAISLKGPCSTSVQHEVAVNFAKSKGIILRLHNDGYTGRYQTFFDCSWISNYLEEAERLWIAGTKPLRIVSIVIVNTARNYAKLMRGLYLFDAMISGVDIEDSNVQEKQSDFKLLSKLMNCTLNGTKVETLGFDEYVQREWELFLQNKKEISLRPIHLQFQFKKLSKLIMFQVTDNRKTEVKGTENVFKPELLRLLHSAKTLHIYTYRNHYKFRFEALLESLKSVSSLNTISIWDRDEWIRNALREKTSDMFQAAGWDIEYLKGNKDEFGEYPEGRLLLKCKL